MRFGMLPDRIKAIIWMREKFYLEVMPNVDLETIKQAAELELLINNNEGYMDYGVDLEDIVEQNRGIQTPCFAKQRDVDTRSALALDERTKKILK